jgi:photosynthetic reaction center cytochrome c subunit
MMRMMLAIDKDSFGGNREVTCYSCHRGSLKPEAVPMVAAGVLPKPQTAALPEREKLSASLPTANELIDRYIQALGGAAAINRVTSREATGTTTLGGQSISIEILYQDPDKQVSIRRMPAGDILTVFNGQEGWSVTPGRPVRDMHGADLEAARIEADLHFPLHIKQNFYELRVEYPEKIGDRETYVVSGIKQGQPPVKLYFDEQSGLLVRLVRYTDSPLGRVPTQIDYDDYRDADGVQVPFRWTVSQADGNTITQVERILENVPIDDARFVRAASSATEPKPSGH